MRALERGYLQCWGQRNHRTRCEVNIILRVLKLASFYPHRRRCIACVKFDRDCSSLPFESMAVHRRDGVDVMVLCDRFMSAMTLAERTTMISPKKSRG